MTTTTITFAYTVRLWGHKSNLRNDGFQQANKQGRFTKTIVVESDHPLYHDELRDAAEDTIYAMWDGEATVKKVKMVSEVTK